MMKKMKNILHDLKMMALGALVMSLPAVALIIRLKFFPYL